MKILIILSLIACSFEIAHNKQNDEIIAWGDSLTYGRGGIPFTSSLQNISHINVINKGVPGETSTQIKNRMLKEPSLFKYPVIIWVGRNNFKETDVIESDISDMVKALNHTHYLILGVITGDFGTGERKGSKNYSLIVKLNQDLAKIYGDHFIDIRSSLISNFNDSDSSSSKNPNEVISSKLRSDKLHLNTDGYLAVAKKINEKMYMLVK